MVPRRLTLRTTALVIVAIVGTIAHAQVGALPEPPRTAVFYVAEGDRHLQAREHAQAVESYNHAIELDPGSPAAYVGLGAAYYRMGRVPDSVTAFDNALRLDPARASAHINRAVSLGALGRSEEALADLAEARRLSAANAALLNQIAVTLENQFAQPADAEAVYRQALAVDPKAAAIHHNLGLLYVKAGRYADAIEPFEAALRIDPAFRNARFFLGESYSRLQQYEASVDSWTKFLALVPDGPDATQNRAWDYLCWGGHGGAAAADAHRWLSTIGWGESDSIYLALVAHFGDLEEGRADAARLVLDEAAVKLTSHAWPYPVVRYFRGEIDENALMDQADTDDKRTEAHAYAGVELFQLGHRDPARDHLQWVVEHGNKRFREYPLAQRVLARKPFVP
jgi:tetratricopeptide (TPR) repeat protein